MRNPVGTIALSLGLVLASACAELGGAPPAATDVPAKRPEATLTIAQPPAGAMLDSGRVTVVVNYNGPPLVPPETATELNQYHLNYLLDVNAGAYLGTRVPIPVVKDSIIHTSRTQASFDRVASGTHLLAVVLTGSNYVSPNPPVAQQISFAVR